ncbi:DNA/RNA polymerase, partial [Colletotrichum zoysiae]
YCDDIVVASKGLDQHIADLREVLTRLREANISLGPGKSFAGFPSAVVLGKQVDSFGTSTTEAKTDAIRKIHFPKTLLALESFIGLAGSMRHHVKGYASIMEPLES